MIDMTELHKEQKVDEVRRFYACLIYKSVYTLHILRNNMYLLSWWELDEESILIYLCVYGYEVRGQLSVA